MLFEYLLSYESWHYPSPPQIFPEAWESNITQAIARTLLQTATDRRPAVVSLYLEAQMIDGGTGELKGEVLRKGLEKQSDNDKVTQEDVKALLDDWIEFYNEGLDRLFDPSRKD